MRFRAPAWESTTREAFVRATARCSDDDRQPAKGASLMLYLAYEAQRMPMLPPRSLAGVTKAPLDTLPEQPAESRPARTLSAACELLMRAELTHERPPFGIGEIQTGRKTYEVVEEVVHPPAFGSLLHFRKVGAPAGPRVLVVAALAGHFATLLRDTVATLLPDHDVYITDW